MGSRVGSCFWSYPRFSPFSSSLLAWVFSFFISFVLCSFFLGFLVFCFSFWFCWNQPVWDFPILWQRLGKLVILKSVGMLWWLFTTIHANVEGPWNYVGLSLLFKLFLSFWLWFLLSSGLDFLLFKFAHLLLLCDLNLMLQCTRDDSPGCILKMLHCDGAVCPCTFPSVAFLWRLGTNLWHVYHLAVIGLSSPVHISVGSVSV